jgi:hypothetical protein
VVWLVRPSCYEVLLLLLLLLLDRAVCCAGLLRALLLHHACCAWVWLLLPLVSCRCLWMLLLLMLWACCHVTSHVLAGRVPLHHHFLLQQQHPLLPLPHCFRPRHHLNLLQPLLHRLLDQPCRHPLLHCRY